MDGLAMRDAFDRDKSIVELRALLASYEERLARTDRTAESHGGQANFSEPLFLINNLAIDPRASALKIEAPTILDCFPPEEPEPFQFVYKVASGVFRVHPRHGRMTTAVVGPFSGAAPSGVVAKVQASHGSAPPIKFHISTWLGEMDLGGIEAKFAATGDPREEPRFLSVPPRHPGYIVQTDSPQSGSGSANSPQTDSAGSSWSLVLATIADPPEETAFAWAEFSDIVLLFATDSGFEGRPLL